MVSSMLPLILREGVKIVSSVLTVGQMCASRDAEVDKKSKATLKSVLPEEAFDRPCQHSAQLRQKKVPMMPLDLMKS